MGTPQPIKGTIFKFKATAGGSYAVVEDCTSKRLPTPTTVTEDITSIGDACVVEANQVNDYGDVELEILYDDADTVHAAMMAAVGSRTDGWIEVTHPNGYKGVYTGNVKQFSDKSGNVRNNRKLDFKMHCNAVPTITAPT